MHSKFRSCSPFCVCDSSLAAGVSEDHQLLHQSQLAHSRKFQFCFYRASWLALCVLYTCKPQAVLFCQLLVPVDYELAFSLLSNHSRCPILVSFYTLYISNTIYTVFPYSSMVESYFSYFWDMVVIEYLICILTKPRQTVSQSKLSRS